LSTDISKGCASFPSGSGREKQLREKSLFHLKPIEPNAHNVDAPPRFGRCTKTLLNTASWQRSKRGNRKQINVEVDENQLMIYHTICSVRPQIRYRILHGPQGPHDISKLLRKKGVQVFDCAKKKQLR
jgi:hypothetical protein